MSQYKVVFLRGSPTGDEVVNEFNCNMETVKTVLTTACHFLKHNAVHLLVDEVLQRGRCTVDGELKQVSNFDSRTTNRDDYQLMPNTLGVEVYTVKNTNHRSTVHD